MPTTAAPTTPAPTPASYTFTSKTELQTAVNLWVSDERSAKDTYGPIADWDTHLITDMSSLFSGKTTFNDDVSSWNTSSVTTMDGMFAGTHPLEAMRCLIHEAATIRDKDDQRSNVIMINDVARAFFEAPAVRQVCVELPDEDKSSSDRTMDKVCHLKMSLYGTRDAAMSWQEEVATSMASGGSNEAVTILAYIGTLDQD